MVFKEGYLHVPRSEMEGKGGAIRIRSLEELSPGGEAEYTRVDGQSIQVEIMARPDGVEADFVYVKARGTPEQLRGFAVPIPKDILEAHPEIFGLLATELEALEQSGELTHQERVEVATDTMETQTSVAGETLADPKQEKAWSAWSGRARRGTLVGVTALISMMALHTKSGESQGAFVENTATVEAMAEVESESKPSELSLIRENEGITHSFKRQLEQNPELASALYYDGSAESLKDIGEMFGYISPDGSEVRVKTAGVAYELVPVGGQVVVREYDQEGQFLGMRTGVEARDLAPHEYNNN